MTENNEGPRSHPPLTALDFHVLVVLAAEDLYGYGIMKAVQEHSSGVVSPEIGSLYRVLARLMEAGWVREVDPVPESPRTHRGKPRRYYGITDSGLEAVRAEVTRLREAVALVEATAPEVAR
jgi:DNA-binding PadR family transcriptional regulator